MEHKETQKVSEMHLAYITLMRDEPTTILAKQYQETIPFWKLVWTPTHVVFYTDVSDEQKFIAYRADRVYELVADDG